MITYLKLGYGEFIRNLKMNFLTAIETALLFATVIFTVSSLSSQLKNYLPFKEILSSDGCVAQIVQSTKYNKSDWIATEEELVNKYPFVNKTYSMARTTLLTNDTGVPTDIYFDTLVNSCKPIMKSGKWLDEVEDDGYLHMIVTEKNFYGLSQDDEFEATDFEGRKIKVKVVGTILDGASVFSHIGGQLDVARIDNFFQSYYYDYYYDEELQDYKGSNMGFAVISEAESKKFDIADFGLSSSISFITVKDGTTTEQLNQLIQGINKTGKAADLAVINQNSLKEVRKSIIFLVPMILGVFLFVVITTICISSINVKRQLRNYGIYYVCGSRWKQCSLISLFSSLITSALAVVLAAAGMFVCKRLGVFSQTVIDFGFWQFVACAATVLISVGFSVIMPIIIIGKTQPREIIKSNE